MSKTTITPTASELAAIIDGTKTMFRMEMKPQPSMRTTKAFSNDWKPLDFSGNEIKSPYQIGQRISVRESWNISPLDQLTSEEINTCIPYYGNPKHYAVVYKASSLTDHHPNHPEWGKKKWLSPATIPKESVRFYLEVIEIKVERLNEISEEDAIKEGCIGHSLVGLEPYSPSQEFKDNYESLHGKGSFDNRWVWVFTVKLIKK
jgi:hypothetical protein